MREKRGAVLTKRQRISRYHGRERGLLFAYDGIQNSLPRDKEKEAGVIHDANIASRVTKDLLDGC